ncbi:MAG: IS200/IS605 family transposase [Candidatus Kapaibacterium sp.]
MSFVKILVHLVFSTKDRRPLMSKEVRNLLFNHITDYASKNGIYLEQIGGWNEHIHLLVSLGKGQSISKVAMLLKGESSHWMNKQKVLSEDFYWQDDYYAVSIGESGKSKLIAYIKNQVEHHKSQGYLQEINEILSKYKMND